jgi:hypothetical protein
LFILYAVLIGFVLGLLTGGRPAGLAEVHLRWSWVIVTGLVVQVLLFSDPVSGRIGALGPPIYVASTAMVIAAVVANRAIPGMLVVAIGAASNLIAIVANGGYMPVSAGAAAILGAHQPPAYSNSAQIPDPLLAPLTDIFALPPWVPFANVFSIGDVLIGVGIVIVIVSAMRSRSAAPGPSVAPSAPLAE